VAAVSEVMFQAMFATAASFALAFNLLSLFISTISSMCGPGMALRGPEGSVSLAVRHMEQQLKRALRFFGRGVVAFIITLTFVGLRFLQDMGFLGGSVTVLVGMWTFGACWHYGADIGEKFHVSPDRAVRGTFVSGPGGTSQWQNTEAELAAQTQHSAGLWCCRQRWRPPTHGITTPLWRLDKMIAFPYHDEASKLRRFSGSSSGGAAMRERAQMEKLVLRAQGPVASSDAACRSDSVGFDSSVCMLSSAFVGGDEVSYGGSSSPSVDARAFRCGERDERLLGKLARSS